jgi:hypothetical protein
LVGSPLASQRTPGSLSLSSVPVMERYGNQSVGFHVRQ